MPSLKCFAVGRSSLVCGARSIAPAGDVDGFDQRLRQDTSLTPSEARPLAVEPAAAAALAAISPLPLLGGWRIFDFLLVDGPLFAADIVTGPGIQRWLDAKQRQDWLQRLRPGAGG